MPEASTGNTTMDGAGRAVTEGEIDAMMDMLDVPMFTIDVGTDGGFSFGRLNRAHQEQTGMRNATASGRALHDVLPTRVADTIAANYRRCVESRERYSYEEVLMMPSGERWWETTLTPVFDEQGHVRRVIGVAIDVTGRKQREFENVEALSRAQKLNKDMKMFASMVAHDLRGPLGNVRSLIDLVKEGFHDLGDNKLAMLETASAVTTTTMGQVEEILRYARALDIEDSKPVEIDFAHMCSDLCGVLDPEGKVEITYPSVMISADLVVLQMIVRNLVHNAIKYGGGAIMIDAEADPKAPGYLVITIADNGPGFPEEDQAVGTAIQAGIDETTTGFGLAAVAHLISSRNGTLRLDSPVFTTGATVRFTLRGEVVRDMLETIVHRKRAVS